MKYTVILHYPDYACDGGPETWCGHVEADCAADAVAAAQRQCAADNRFISDQDDLLPISVFEGEHQDLIGQWVNAQ